MTIDETNPPLCARVLDALVEGRDVGGDRELGEHLRSCMSCFRALTELRDAPRLAALLRADPLHAPQQAAQNERFWSDLAERTTAAAASALGAPRGVRPHRRFGLTRVGVRALGAVAALAAAFALLVAVRGSRPVAPLSPQAGAVVSGVAVNGLPERELRERELREEEGMEVEVGDLDGVALRRLADRLRAGVPEGLTGLMGVNRSVVLAGALESDTTDGAELDDAQVNDELAELDSSALLRVERSLAGASL